MRALVCQLLAGPNQLASGGLVLMLIGGAVAWLRQVPSQLWSWIVS